MNSCIFIDGLALWAIVFLVAIAFAGFICFGNFWLAEVRENDRLRREIKEYSAQLEEYKKAEYKHGFLEDIISDEYKTAKFEDGRLMDDIISLGVSALKSPKGGDRRG